MEQRGGRPTLENAGASSSGASTTTINGLLLTNSGTVRVETGTLSSDGVDVSGGTLTGGTWAVLDNATLDLAGATILNNSASVTLDGANSSFAAFDSVQVNNAAGAVTLRNSRAFTTSGAFTNDGALGVGAGSTFACTGSLPHNGTVTIEAAGLVNTARGELQRGDRHARGRDVRRLGDAPHRRARIHAHRASVVLDGPRAAISSRGADAIANLGTIDAAETLELAGGRDSPRPATSPSPPRGSCASRG